MPPHLVKIILTWSPSQDNSCRISLQPFFFSRQDFSVPQRSTCFSLLNAEIKSMHHHCPTCIEHFRGQVNQSSCKYISDKLMTGHLCEFFYFLFLNYPFRTVYYHVSFKLAITMLHMISQSSSFVDSIISNCVCKFLFLIPLPHHHQSNACSAFWWKFMHIHTVLINLNHP